MTKGQKGDTWVLSYKTRSDPWATGYDGDPTLSQHSVNGLCVSWEDRSMAVNLHGIWGNGREGMINHTRQNR